MWNLSTKFIITAHLLNKPFLLVPTQRIKEFQHVLENQNYKLMTVFSAYTLEFVFNNKINLGALDWMVSCYNRTTVFTFHVPCHVELFSEAISTFHALVRFSYSMNLFMFLHILMCCKFFRALWTRDYLL